MTLRVTIQSIDAAIHTTTIGKKTGGTEYKRHESIVAHTGSFQFSTLMKYDVISTAKAVFTDDEEEEEKKKKQQSRLAI